MARYVPRQGDFVILTFDPQSGHEQKGRRPALVVSKTLFNKHTGLAILCPITNTSRGYPFHVAVPDESKLTGFVMVEQIKSVDFGSRKVKYVEKAPRSVLNEVLAILDACLYDSAS
ncbi:MAG: mRNA-degrading endonuclease [Planctomycetota bacterium]|nr:MAG: mRNA-degrading endonuclease [Planctomycetota bacterium]